MTKFVNKSFKALFWAQFCGAMVDNFFKSAFLVLVTYKNVELFGMKPASIVALSGGVFILPFFLFSPISGQLSEKYDRTFITRIIKWGELILSIVAIMSLLFDNYYFMLLVLFGFGTQAAFFGPIKYSFIPALVEKHHLIMANAYVSAGTFVAICLGTLLGGALSGMVNGFHFIAFGLVFLTSMGVFSSYRIPHESLRIRNPHIKISWNLITATVDILKLAFYDTHIFILVLGISWFWLLGSAFISFVPLIAKNVYSGNEMVASFLLWTFTLGMGLGPIIMQKITRGEIKLYLIPLSLIGMTIAMGDIGYVLKVNLQSNQLFNRINDLTFIEFLYQRNALRILFDFLLLSMFGGIFTVVQFSELQRKSAVDKLSRSVAANNILNALCMVFISMVLMLSFENNIKIYEIIGVLAIVNLLWSILMGPYYFKFKN